ncbi:MAG: HDOD domain-containing protein [Rhodoferax sp.]|jgi:serine/threonine protein kinase|nr:HDOD domain-containing protein [Rhodoferax sp.]
MSPVAAARATERLGRFELLRTLGRGAQATVWLAHDPRLDREVALKLLDLAASDGVLAQWLHEARAVSRLAHPNVVPVFEAVTIDGQPCLVFEYVDGPTLAQARRGHGPMPAREAVTLTMGMLDALATAHAQGLVHRDLKPSNVLIGQDGRPRVMDFGIAAHTDRGGDGLIVGTPGYMSPEAARGEAATPAMDVFAAGMMLAELLAGAPLLRERDPMRAIERVQREDFALPASVQVDETLRAIVARAVARDPLARYDSARSLHAALADWLGATSETVEPAAGGHGTLEFLLRRMRTKRDFPALASSITRIQRVAASETESMSSLADAILEDVALTNKLLRMVNTVHFASAGAGSIATVSRAVALVGFAGIRNMALSVVLLEHMHDKQHQALIREEFLRALMTGTLASQMTASAREAEEGFIGAMFQNLGRLLVAYYFPEEAQQIRQLAPQDGAAGREAAAIKVLGLTANELGRGVARNWGLPASLQRAMDRPDEAPPARALQPGAERARWAGRAAAEWTDLMLAHAGEVPRAQLGRLAEAYGPSLGLRLPVLEAAGEAARARFATLVDGLGVAVPREAAAYRLLPTAAQSPAGLGGDETHAGDGLASTAILPPDTGHGVCAGDSTAGRAAQPVADAPTGSPTRSPEPGLAPARTGMAAPRLTAGVQAITEHMGAGNFRLDDVLRMVLQTMQGALGLRRALLCLREPGRPALRGRFALGDGAEALAPRFEVALRTASGVVPDLFAAVCAKGVDTLIADAAAPTIAARLPAWFSAHVRAPTFLLLPLMLRSACFGLIYADHARAGAIALDERELALLRALRDQAVRAFQQGGRG